MRFLYACLERLAKPSFAVQDLVGWESGFFQHLAGCFRHLHHASRFRVGIPMVMIGECSTLIKA
jgi:hypothetical protein